MLAFRQVPVRTIRQFRNTLLWWFRRDGRRLPWRLDTSTLYERVLAEVFLQRTRAETVAAFLPLFVARYQSWSAISSADEAELVSALRPIGLADLRAPRLKRLAAALAHGHPPDERKELERLSGVGQYIASSILLFAHNRREPLVDTNMARVLERYFGERHMADIRDDPYLQALARAVVDDPRAVDVNWAIMDLGALICRPRNPACDACPLASGCRFASSNDRSAAAGEVLRVADEKASYKA